MKSTLAALLAFILILTGCGNVFVPAASDYGMTIQLPDDRYPETMAHIAAAIQAGASAVCTIDRDGADANREASLRGIPTKKGYDRDEWPMAMCKEGGDGADIAYVSPADNRGAGSWIGNLLTDLEDGTSVLFVVDEMMQQPITKQEAVHYSNCTEARAAGAAPLYDGDPGYSLKLDRNKDGVACN